jgi:WD40 repeat protein
MCAGNIANFGSSTLFCSDKTGHVRAFCLPSLKNSVSLGGHATSIVTGVDISPCENFLVSSDRDEKIKVSCLPQTLSIQAYCLGHTGPIIDLCFIKLHPRRKEYCMISIGGDGMIGIWDYSTGNLLDKIDAEDKRIPLQCTSSSNLPIMAIIYDEVKSVEFFGVLSDGSTNAIKLRGQALKLDFIPSNIIFVGDSILVTSHSTQSMITKLFKIEMLSNIGEGTQFITCEEAQCLIGRNLAIFCEKNELKMSEIQNALANQRHESLQKVILNKKFDASELNAKAVHQRKRRKVE